MNPAPDADIHSVGEFYHNWVTNAVTNMVFKRLAEPQTTHTRYRWDAFLNPEAAATEPAQALAAVASAAEQAARTIVPEPIRDLGAEIITGVGHLVDQAATAVSDIVDSVMEPSAKKTKNTKRDTETSTQNTRRTTTKKPSTPRTKKPAPEM